MDELYFRAKGVVMELLWFVLASYGMTYLIVYASIFNKVRPAKEWLGGLGKVFTVPCVWVFMWGGFYLPLMNGQNYLLLTTH